jgi:cytochrome subunit of sulfide dehydrogenase
MYARIYMKYASLFVWVTLTGACAAADAQSQDAVLLYQRSLAATCANCHGTEGKGIEVGGMPLIHQLTPQEMLTQLMAYKSGVRPGTIMPQLAKGYTDEQLQIIATVLGKK